MNSSIKPGFQKRLVTTSPRDPIPYSGIHVHIGVCTLTHMYIEINKNLLKNASTSVFNVLPNIHWF